jgi:predicted DNA-binding transcriptional regulator AlpA
MAPRTAQRWLRIEEVVRQLHISRQTAYKRMALPASDPRHLPSKLIGGSRRVSEGDLLDHQARLRAQDIETQALAEVYDMDAGAIARHFDISPRSALRLLADKRIPSRWVGAQRRARREDVEAYAS